MSLQKVFQFKGRNHGTIIVVPFVATCLLGPWSLAPCDYEPKGNQSATAEGGSGIVGIAF